MFVSFFPMPKLFFASAAGWSLFLILLWFFGGAQMGALVGLWRVLSFLGLGLALIALGAVYQRFVLPPRAATPAPGAAPPA